MNITNIDNKYTIQVGYEFEIEKNINTLMKQVIPITNYTSRRVCTYHTGKDETRKGLWRVELDSSLVDGAEFISPPMLMEDSFGMMRKFFQTVKENKSTTSTRCGCHTNMCLMHRGKILKINENALVYNLNWRLLCSLWPNRLKKKNTYCEYINHILKKNINLYDFDKPQNKKKFGQRIFESRNSFIIRKSSLSSREGIYYELRFPGGVNYHLYPEKIEATVRHFKEVLIKSRLAVCKTNNIEHNKKIMSYINRNRKASIYSYKKDSVCIPGFVGATKPSIKNIRQLKNIKNIVNINDKKSTYITLINMISNIVYLNARYSHEEIVKDVAKTINKENTIYHMYKFGFVYRRETGLDITSLLQSVASLLRMENVKFTIPKNEKDLNKLWLIELNKELLEQVEPVLIESIASNRIKILLNKLIQNKKYLKPEFVKIINRISMESSNGVQRIKI